MLELAQDLGFGFDDEEPDVDTRAIHLVLQ